MRVGWTSRMYGFVLVFFVLALTLSGCSQPQPKPKEAAAALANAKRLEEQNRREDAMKEFFQAAHLDPKGPTAPEANLRAADLAVDLGHPDQAALAYQALRTYPKPAVVEMENGPVRIPQDLNAQLKRAADDLHRIKTSQPLTLSWHTLASLVPYRFMDFLVGLTGKHPAYSYWIAILIFTCVLKVAMNPLTVTQQRSSRKMMLIQPKLKEIQDRYREEPAELNRRMIALYKEEGVNPIGCGSGMILQMAIMLALYHVIRDYQFQFYNAHFLWIGSGLSHQYPTVLATSLAMPDKPLLVVYAISMFVQSKLTMVPTLDPMQAQQQKMMTMLMPLMLFMFLQAFPSAFALYWLLFNVLSTVQMIHINKQLDAQYGPRTLAPAAETGGNGSGGTDEGGDGGVKKSTAPPLKKGPGGGAKKNNRRR